MLVVHSSYFKLTRLVQGLLPQFSISGDPLDMNKLQTYRTEFYETPFTLVIVVGPNSKR